MPIIDDKEFGPITIRRSSNASGMKVTVAPNGYLRISAPSYAPLFMVKRMIATSRDELRRLRSSHPSLELHDGMTIGKSHSLTVRSGNSLTVTRSGQRIILTLGPENTLEENVVADLVRKHIIQALRREAKAHLPKRLAYLAEVHGFEYRTVRFSHASGRWGSCTTQGTISLNIALMQLSFELIDYVLLHELTHTEHMNHSAAFWSRLEQVDPACVHHRKVIKSHSPSI